MGDRPLYIPGPRWRLQPRGPEAWGTWLHKPLHESITEVCEAKFIEKVLGDLHYRSSVFNIENLDAEGALIKAGVQLREFRKDLVGDIDILVVPRGKPEESTAIQVKRLPVMVAAQQDEDIDSPDFREWERRQRIDKMRRLFQEGIEQANRDAAVGFSRVFLWVFVLADSRRANGARYTYDGMDPSRASEVNCALSAAGLDPRVGLVRYEWVQPMDRPPLELATYHSSFLSSATRVPQPAALTSWLGTVPP